MTTQPFMGLATLRCGHTKKAAWWSRKPELLFCGLEGHSARSIPVDNVEVTQEGLIPEGLARHLELMDNVLVQMDSLAMRAVDVIGKHPEYTDELHSVLGGLQTLQMYLSMLKKYMINGEGTTK